MKYCTKCGTSLADNDSYCSKCGAWQYVESQQGQQHQQSQQHQQPQKPPYNKGIATANKVLLIILCVSLFVTAVEAIVFSIFSAKWLEDIGKMMQDLEEQYGATVSMVYWVFANFGVMGAWLHALPLAWVLPMTLHYFKKNKANQPTTLSFKICTLIFVHLLVGIFMLCFEQSQETPAKVDEQFRQTI